MVRRLFEKVTPTRRDSQCRIRRRRRSRPSPGAYRLPIKRDSFFLLFWRRWLPIALCIFGIVIGIVDGFDLYGVDAFAAFCGAGLSIALTNVLWRIGISGNLDRDDEEDARTYLAEHGHWPEDRLGRTPPESADPPRQG
jgi:hypothetical protein